MFPPLLPSSTSFLKLEAFPLIFSSVCLHSKRTLNPGILQNLYSESSTHHLVLSKPIHTWRTIYVCTPRRRPGSGMVLPQDKHIAPFLTSFRSRMKLQPSSLLPSSFSCFIFLYHLRYLYLELYMYLSSLLS